MANRKEQKAETRAKLLEVAGACFRTLGYERATMRDIARTAGFSVGAIFANWPDKAALYAEIYGHPPITPEQGRELVAVLRGEKARPKWLLAMSAAEAA